MTVRVKTCGLSTPEAVEAAAGADYIGFIFYPPSPRNVTLEKAAELASASQVPAVAVTVDADNALLGAILKELRPSLLQLHGKETPARVKEVKQLFGVSVIKAISVSSGDDVARAKAYEEGADMLMFDARAPKGLPGGTGLNFDWQLLAGRSFAKPWFLSGGLGIDNVEKALRISGARMVDVSSSLESTPGVKDPERVREFVKKVKSLPL